MSTPQSPVELPRPPANWRDVDGWDAYWRATLESKDICSDRKPIYDMLLNRYVHNWRSLARQRVLILGNGLSIEPHVLAQIGFAVTAVDVSRVAIEALKADVPSKEDLDRMFQILDFDANEPNGSFLARASVVTGSSELVCGDFLDPAVAPGPFDVIVNHRALQGFSADDRALAVERIDARLADTGSVHITVQNNHVVNQELHDQFARRGYIVTAA